MNDRIDKIVKEKISDYIENNEIQYDPEHWSMLVAKKKKRRRAVFFRRIAALLILLLLAGGLGTMLINKSGGKDAIDQQIIHDTTTDSLKTDSLQHQEEKVTTTLDGDSLQNLDQITVEKNAVKTKEKLLPNYQKIIETERQHYVDRIAQEEPQDIVKDSLLLARDHLAAKDSLKNIIVLNQKNISPKKEVITEQEIVIKNDTLWKDTSIALADKKIKKDSLNAENEIITAFNEEVVDEKNNRRPVKFGINASPSVYYNKAYSDSEIGFAGGISVEVPISSKFDLATGLLYTDQTMNLMRASNNQMNASGEDYLTFNTSYNMVEKAKTAILKGIEIPINLKYNFTINKKQLFVSAGISSTAYFKEEIINDFMVLTTTETIGQDESGNYFTNYDTSQSNRSIVTSSGSSKFYFANLLNLSAGVGIPMGKQTLILEPYLKYSLSPITQQKINFTSAGIYLRYNFVFKKK